MKLEKAYTWKKAEKLEMGDVFVTRNGHYAGQIIEIFHDPEGVWVSDTLHEGYVDYGKEFRISR